MSARLLRRSSRRSWLHHPLQLALSILGVALGVAVAVSVDLANESARRAFRVSTEAVTGPATHQIVAGSEGFAEELYPRLRIGLGIRASAPVVDGWIDGPDGRPLRLLGIDPFAEGTGRPLDAGTEGGGIDLATLIGAPDAVFATRTTAEDLGIAPGDSFDVRVDGRAAALRLAGLLGAGSGLGTEGLRGVLVADIATAQELLGRIGRLDRIDLVLEPDDPRLGPLREMLPGSAVLAAAAARADSTLEMTRAFSLNLRAMSLLAVVCGVFLIYNTMTFSVVRRRPLIGQLRVLGVTRGEIFGLVLREAAWIGVVGTVLGLAAGWLLASGMVQLVTRTINDLYFTVTVREVVPAASSLLRGVAIGIGATLAAAIGPAREATRTQPRAVLQRSEIEGRARALMPALAWAGLAAATVGGLLLALPGDSLLMAFTALFLLLVGASLATPAATWALARLAAPPLRRVAGLLGSLAARGVTANLSRTAVAVAALMIAVAVIIGVGVMVGSFRDSLEGWLGYTLQADLYVSPAGDSGPGRTLRLPEEFRERLERDPAVEGVSTIRVTELATGSGTTQLLALEPGPSTPDAYDLLEGGPGAWRAFVEGAALVSEPYAFRSGVGAGDTLRLPAPGGAVELEVAGVFRSYASDRGAVLVHRDTYERVWNDTELSGLSIDIREGADREALRERVEAAFVDGQRVTVISNEELRRQSLVVFDRTFLITGVLRALVSLVAFVGVFASLMAMALERSRELGILRATGLTPRQMFGLVTAQTGLLGLIAGLLALPLGVVLAWVMIHVINRRSFGWSMEMHVPAEVLIEALAIAVVAALLAGLWPAARRARGLPAAALREE